MYFSLFVDQVAVINELTSVSKPTKSIRIQLQVVSRLKQVFSKQFFSLLVPFFIVARRAVVLC